MASATISKKKLQFVPPTARGNKPVVHLDSGRFKSVQKNFENLVIGGFVGRRPLFLFVKEAVQKIWSYDKTLSGQVFFF